MILMVLLLLLSRLDYSLFLQIAFLSISSGCVQTWKVLFSSFIDVPISLVLISVPRRHQRFSARKEFLRNNFSNKLLLRTMDNLFVNSLSFIVQIFPRSDFFYLSLGVNWKMFIFRIRIKIWKRRNSNTKSLLKKLLCSKKWNKTLINSLSLFICLLLQKYIYHKLDIY